MSQVIAALAAIKEIIDVVKSIFKLYKEAKREGWINEGKELTKKVENAKTPQERKKLVSDMLDHINGL